MASGSEKNQIPFTKKNYFVMAGGVALIAFGYYLMTGEKFVDATQFSVSLYVSPFLIIAGLIMVGAGIMVRSKNDSPSDDQQKQ